MFIDLKPTYLVFNKVHSLLYKNVQQLPPSVTNLKNNKTKFKAALRKYTHTHTLLLLCR